MFFRTDDQIRAALFNQMFNQVPSEGDGRTTTYMVKLELTLSEAKREIGYHISLGNTEIVKNQWHDYSQGQVDMYSSSHSPFTLTSLDTELRTMELKINEFLKDKKNCELRIKKDNNNVVNEVKKSVTTDEAKEEIKAIRIVCSNQAAKLDINARLEYLKQKNKAPSFWSRYSGHFAKQQLEVKLLNYLQDVMTKDHGLNPQEALLQMQQNLATDYAQVMQKSQFERRNKTRNLFLKIAEIETPKETNSAKKTLS